MRPVVLHRDVAEVPILSVENLTVAFNTRQGPVRVVDDVGFHVEQNEVLAIVGESGSGKTVSVLAVLRLLRTPPAEIVAGRANFLGEDLLRADRQTLHAYPGRPHRASSSRTRWSPLNPVADD